MSVAKANIKLSWKQHNVDLEAFDAWLRSNVDNYCGNSADSKELTLWFSEAPSEEDRDAAVAKWNSIGKTSAMAKSYQSRQDAEDEKAGLKASGRQKLLALGLTEEEVAALIG